jgi:beta-xylosidase
VFGIARSSGDIVFSHSVTLTGPVRVVDHTRPLHAVVEISR